MAMNNTMQALRSHRPYFILIIGVLAVVFLLEARQNFDRYVLARPWVNPTIEVMPNAGGKPDIKYGARSITEMRGRWTAWMEVNGRRCCTFSDSGLYLPANAPRLWEWEDFFGRDWPVPTQPFRICTSYDLTTNSGAKANFGPFCSLLYKP